MLGELMIVGAFLFMLGVVGFIIGLTIYKAIKERDWLVIITFLVITTVILGYILMEQNI